MDNEGRKASRCRGGSHSASKKKRVEKPRLLSAQREAPAPREASNRSGGVYRYDHERAGQEPRENYWGNDDINMIFNYFTLFADVDRNDLWAFAQDNCNAHVIVINFDVKSTDEALKLKKMVHELFLWRWQLIETDFGMVAWNWYLITSTKQLLCEDTKNATYAVYEFMVTHTRAVAVGVIFNHPEACFVNGTSFKKDLVDTVKTSLKEKNVSVLAGLFLCPKEQVTEMVRDGGTKLRHPFVQMWKHQDPQPLEPSGDTKDSDAVAEDNVSREMTADMFDVPQGLYKVLRVPRVRHNIRPVAAKGEQDCNGTEDASVGSFLRPAASSPTHLGQSATMAPQ